MHVIESSLPKGVLSPVATTFAEKLRVANGRFAWQTQAGVRAGASAGSTGAGAVGGGGGGGGAAGSHHAITISSSASLSAVTAALTSAAALNSGGPHAGPNYAPSGSTMAHSSGAGAAAAAAGTGHRTRFSLGASTSYSELRSALAGLQAVEHSGVIAPPSTSSYVHRKDPSERVNLRLVQGKGSGTGSSQPGADDGAAAIHPDSILAVERSELDISIIRDHFK